MDQLPAMSFDQQICKLEQSVINQICAGEVIHRPYNVVKELIENSLDAGATHIIIALKNGGLQQIMIQDNGCGIHKDDLEIVCQRFTTSKLKTFDDLRSLSTFGFRGEALSSVSTVSQMTIISKTAVSVCGYKAEFVDGKLKENTSISAIASGQGTKIIVDNLFYNMPTRRTALTSESTEFALIQDLILKYSIILTGQCTFLLKKNNDNSPAINTNLTSTVPYNIDSLFAQKISSHLIPITIDNAKLSYKVDGYFSNGDLNLRKFTFILSINRRVVECSSLKKSLKEIYKNFLLKSGHPFVFLTIEVNPQNIDVNVHPAKLEVCFLYQNEMIAEIIHHIQTRLRAPGENQVASQETSFSNKSLQSSVLSGKVPGNDESPVNPSPVRNSDTSRQSTSSHQTKMWGHLVDSRTNSPATPPSHHQAARFGKDSSAKKSATRCNKQIRIDPNMQRIDHYLGQKKTESKRREMNLKSVEELREEVVNSLDSELLDMVSKSDFVGCIKEDYLLIQHNLNLVLLNMVHFNYELFYQIFLFDFGNFDYIKFKTPLPLEELLKFFLEETKLYPDKENQAEKIERITELLVSKCELMNDYFSFKINADTKCIEAIPLVCKGHTPMMAHLPELLYRLAVDVKWKEEKECFRTCCHQLARFYSRPPSLPTPESLRSWAQLVESQFHHLYKTLLFPSSKLKEKMSFHVITNVTNLYKVFERC